MSVIEDRKSSVELSGGVLSLSIEDYHRVIACAVNPGFLKGDSDMGELKRIVSARLAGNIKPIQNLAGRIIHRRGEGFHPCLVDLVCLWVGDQDLAHELCRILENSSC